MTSTHYVPHSQSVLVWLTANDFPRAGNHPHRCFSMIFNMWCNAVKDCPLFAEFCGSPLAQVNPNEQCRFTNIQRHFRYVSEGLGPACRFSARTMVPIAQHTHSSVNAVQTSPCSFKQLSFLSIYAWHLSQSVTNSFNW